MLTDYDYFGGPEASRGWAPEYIDRLSIPDGEQHWKFARAWTLGEIVTALLGAGLRLERVTEHPVDWWAGHRDVRPEERGRVPLSFSVAATPRRLNPPGGHGLRGLTARASTEATIAACGTIAAQDATSLPSRRHWTSIRARRPGSAAVTTTSAPRAAT